MLDAWMKALNPAPKGRAGLRMSIANKFALLTTLLVAGTAIALGLVLYKIASGALLDLEVENLRYRVHQSAEQLANRLENVQRTTLALSRTPPIKGIMATEAHGGAYDGSTTRDWKQRLATIFSGTLEANPDFLQVRYIGVADGGREIVRVDRVGDRIVPTDAAALQRKGERPYFQGAIKYKEGTVYVSEIELNQEAGKVVVPYQPTQRVATPVFTDQGAPFGIVIINVNADLWLAGMSKYSAGTSTLYLTNESGDFLLHSDAEKTFGFDRGVRFRVFDEIPELAAFYDGLQHKDSELLSGDQVVIATQISYDPQRPERHFVAVAVSDRKVVLARTIAMGKWSVLITLAVIALSFPLARLLSRPLDTMMRTAGRIAAGDIFAGSQKPTGVRDEVGVLAQAFGVMTDAVRKREKSLQESVATTRAILESAGNAILTVGDDCRIESVNVVARRMFGYAGEELVGENIAVLLPPGTCDQLKASFDSGVEARNFAGLAQEARARRKEGTVVPVYVTMAKVDLADRRIWAVVMTDLTEVKKADQAKDEFVSMVSHELRTPLTSIRGSLGLLSAGTAGELPEAAATMIDIAQRNCSGLIYLINDILDMEKIRSGKMEFEFHPTELRPLLVDAMRKNSAYAEQYDVEIRLTEPLPDVAINADADRITQVLDNLLSNAAKFSAPNSAVDITAQTEGDRVRVSVIDRGPGIAEESRASIFKEFVQVDSSARRKKGGTGLGLSIVKSIVEAHGGTVDFHSTPGGGTTFFFVLPCHEAGRVSQSGPLERRASAS